MTLIRYLFKKFIPTFLGAIFFFSIMLVLIDLLINLWTYIQCETPVSVILKIMLLYFPKSLWYGAPLAVLFAVSFTLSALYADNELTVIFASGVSLLRFTMPLLIFGAVLSVSFFWFENKLVVPAYREKVALQQSALGEERSSNNDRVVVLSDKGRAVYKADYYDDQNQRLYNLYVVLRDENMLLDMIVHADSAYWDEDRWILSNGIVYRWNGEQLQVSTGAYSVTERLTEIPDTFRNFEISVDEVNTEEAREYIRLLQRTGLPAAEARSVYYKKFAFPSIIFIVVFLSIGLSGKSRRNVLLVSLISCVSAAVLFYVTQMVTMYLAKFGYITPFAGAWTPVIIFVLISIGLVRFART
ncbi:MAG: LptF/LptG family permease [Treponemataceae bacterium]|nr:LptF/LptG family permease [Treponemataceae bacterium]